MPSPFKTEADLVAAFCSEVEASNSNKNRAGPRWTPYHETAGFDLLLVSDGGMQIGIEAKLTLNPKVLEQVLPGHRYWGGYNGPDYRAVLVGRSGLQNHLSLIAGHLGITVITPGEKTARYQSFMNPGLPDEDWDYSISSWHPWLPSERCKLPEYVPDVIGGHSSPVALTDWKISAIKLLIILARRGFVTRADMKALKLSPTRWTAAYGGFLTPGLGGYVRCELTPDLKAQHPKNWAEIEADVDKWSAGIATITPLKRRRVLV